MSRKKKKQDPKKKVVKLEAKPLQLSFKDNLKKKITYFKSIDAFKFTRIGKDDEERLAGCLRRVEERAEEMTGGETAMVDQTLDQTSIQSDTPADQTPARISTPADQSTTQTSTSSDQTPSVPADPAKSSGPDDATNDKKLKLKKRMELIKKEFVFGFNEIVKKLKDQQIVGIMLAGQLTNHVQRTVLELASSQKVAVLIANNMEFYQSFFKISRISCFALLLSTRSESSIYNEFSRTFFEISEKFGDLRKAPGEAPGEASGAIELAAEEMAVDEDSLDEVEENKEEKGLQEEAPKNEKREDQEASKQQPPAKRPSNKPKKLKINPIAFDVLWMPVRSPGEPCDLKSSLLVSTGEFNKSDDLLLISEERTDDHFPARLYT